MSTGILHLKVKRSPTAVLTHSDCDWAMKDCEIVEKGKIPRSR